MICDICKQEQNDENAVWLGHLLTCDTCYRCLMKDEKALIHVLRKLIKLENL